MRWILLVLIIIFVGYGWHTTIFTPISLSFSPSQIPEDVEGYLLHEEAKFADIKPGLQKQIIWNDPASKQKTAYSIVSIHGFSTSKEEIRPIPDNMAAELGANLFYTRLAGHGRTIKAMGEVSYNDWVNDTAEAFEVGRRIGDKTIIIATSLGGALATWLLKTKDEYQEDIAAIILVSPSYELEYFGTSLITAPYASLVVRALLGPTRCDNMQATLREFYAFSVCYPTKSLLPLAQFIDLAFRSEKAPSDVPALFIYGLEDKVVDSVRTNEVYETWGSNTERLLLENTKGSPSQTAHVPIGDFYDPQNNSAAMRKISSWLHEVTQEKSVPDSQ
ncbi:alpha/beta hydrolase [Flexibacterium corallicola]|uniref:alpha/beta hydrolase n=1 Tax=Flexibacterium corallicola TaxID=3037259 RepID=UPI00286EFF1B|nr:alpha/beta fold hydrolase [Pseudovibrio sp. M1P-2-3]